MSEKKLSTAQPRIESAILDLAAFTSVVVPLASGRDQEMKRLTEAILAQTVQPKEIIIETGPNAYVNRNRGWQKAEGDIIWFLDSDMVPDPDALEKALALFTLDTPEGVEGHIYGSVQRVFKWGFMTGHIFYMKEALEKVGGFDEWFVDWRGDTDLGWSIIDAGGLILYQPLSRALHAGDCHTKPNLEAEQRLYDKHPDLYRSAQENGYLQCIIHE